MTLLATVGQARALDGREAGIQATHQALNGLGSNAPILGIVISSYQYEAQQVITNLVSNANKYTPDGGTVTVGAEKCRNQWDPDGASEVVHMWVKDTGIGISLEDQKKIFQKFFRSEDSKAREAPGTGLGLNITKSLVEMMGGQIWFESEFRQGTTFHFTVPVAEG